MSNSLIVKPQITAHELALVQNDLLIKKEI